MAASGCCKPKLFTVRKLLKAGWKGGSEHRHTKSEQRAGCSQLVLVTDGNRVLLGKKKRGFGEGYFNGFGGKARNLGNVDVTHMDSVKAS